MADLKTSQLPILSGADLLATDKVLVLDKSATSGPGSGTGGTLKQMDAGRIASFQSTKGVVRNISLVGIATEGELFTWVAQAINTHGPYYGNPGEDFYFRTYQVSGPQNNYSVTIMYFKLLSGRLVAGGPGNTIAPSELVLSGGPFVVNNEVNADLFLAIGDAGAGPVHTYFNLGENHLPGGDPWTVSGQIFLTGVLNGQPTIWQFLAGDGDWGGDSGNNTTAADFINLSLQPPAVGFELTKVHNLSLFGVDLNQPELNYIARAVLDHGPFTCLPGQQMVFKVQTTVGTQTSGSVVRRYYRLLRNYTSIGGLSFEVPLPSWFMPDGNSYVQPLDAPNLIVELGDIGTADVWTAFNLGDAGEAWDMGIYRFVRATQNGEIQLWAFEGQERFYGGGDAGVEPDVFLAVAEDFFLITAEPSLPSQGMFTNTYDDIAEMLSEQAEQNTLNRILVQDATADPNITFASGETKVQAEYRFNGTATGSIDDYTLISAPYGNHSVSKQITKSANYTLDPTENDATIISEGKICTIDPITKTYPSAFTVAMKNDGAATNLVIVPKTGWSYQLNDADAVSLTTGGSNVTLTWTKGGTCTVILKGSTNKILIDGGIE